MCRLFIEGEGSGYLPKEFLAHLFHCGGDAARQLITPRDQSGRLGKWVVVWHFRIPPWTGPGVRKPPGQLYTPSDMALLRLSL